MPIKVYKILPLRNKALRYPLGIVITVSLNEIRRGLLTQLVVR
jgi:hypothetical protein